MKRSRFLPIAVLALLFGMLLSGCFQIRAVFIAPRALGVGETATMKVVLSPYGLNWLTDAKVVIMVGTDADGLDFRNIGRFDKPGFYGGPYRNTRNDPLRAHLLAPGNCTAFGLDATDITGFNWVAYATNDPVDITGVTAADMADQFVLRLKVDRQAGTDNGEAGHLIVFSAMWADTDLDGVYDAGEVALCTSVVMTSIAFVP